MIRIEPEQRIFSTPKDRSKKTPTEETNDLFKTRMSFKKPFSGYSKPLSKPRPQEGIQNKVEQQQGTPKEPAETTKDSPVVEKPRISTPESRVFRDKSSPFETLDKPQFSFFSYIDTKYLQVCEKLNISKENAEKIRKIAMVAFVCLSAVLTIAVLAYFHFKETKAL